MPTPLAVVAALIVAIGFSTVAALTALAAQPTAPRSAIALTVPAAAADQPAR